MTTLHRLMFAFIFASVLMGCEQPVSPDSVKNNGLVYCGLGQPNTFNPQRTDGGLTADALSSQLFDRLLQLNPSTFKPIPMLAEKWDVSPDGKTYTFHLRQNVNFQSPNWFTPTRTMNANDVVFSFERLINPQHSSNYLKEDKYPWFDSMDFSGLVKDVVALDENTVQFTLSRPDVSFLSTLATNYAAIHSEEYATGLLATGKLQDIDDFPVGTGAFYLDKYNPNRFIRLKRHNGYWNGGAKMKQIIYDLSNRGTGSLSKLITHECDILTSPATSQLSVIAQNPELVLTSQMGMNLAYLSLNTAHPILSKQEVRQAISLGINRTALIQSVYYGTGTPAVGILPPMSWAYDESSTMKFNPQLARTLLVQAGYRQGFSLDLLVPITPRPYNPSPRKTAEIIRSDLAAIGITVNITTTETVSSKQLRKNINQIDMVLTGWIADNGDPDNFLRPHLSCKAQFKGWNLSNWCNENFDRLLDAAIATNKREQRQALYIAAQAILRDRMPVIPLAHGVNYQAQSANLDGIEFNPFGDKSFVNVSRNP